VTNLRIVGLTNRLRLLGVAALFVSNASVADAHHSFAAEFDGDKPITLKGTIYRIDLVNPHSWLYVDVKNPDGTMSRWNVEMGAPNALIRKGVTKASVPVGAEVTVEGFRAKDGSNTANGRTVLLADGRSLFTGSSYTGPAPSDLNRR
jgi:hypothetical protein